LASTYYAYFTIMESKNKTRGPELFHEIQESENLVLDP